MLVQEIGEHEPRRVVVGRGPHRVEQRERVLFERALARFELLELHRERERFRRVDVGNGPRFERVRELVELRRETARQTMRCRNRSQSRCDRCVAGFEDLEQRRPLPVEPRARLEHRECGVDDSWVGGASRERCQLPDDAPIALGGLADRLEHLVVTAYQPARPPDQLGMTARRRGSPQGEGAVQTVHESRRYGG